MTQFIRTKVLSSGKNTTGIEISPDVVERLGKGRRPPVRVTIGTYSYRSSIAVMGGRFMLGISAEHRAGAGVAAGDEIDVALELDTEPREVEVPTDLAEALGRDAAAREFFEGLSYSLKRWHVESITGAKTPETRQRRIQKSVAMLHEKRAR